RPLASGRTSPDEASSPSASGRGRATPALGLRHPRGRRCQVKSTAPSRRDRIRSLLADLKMPGALEAVDSVLSGLDSGALTGADVKAGLELDGFTGLDFDTPAGVGGWSGWSHGVGSFPGLEGSVRPALRRWRSR